MGVRAALSASPLMGVGGLALVGTVLMGGYYLEEQEVCTTAQPPTCAHYVDAPAERTLETGGDSNYAAALKSGVATGDLRDYRPEYSYTYEACSARTSTGLMVAGTPATTVLCQALGCNYKQCVQKRTKCDQSDGTEADDYLVDGTPAADLFCVAAKLHSNIQPGKFAALLFALAISVGMCAVGAMGGGAHDD